MLNILFRTTAASTIPLNVDLRNKKNKQTYPFIPYLLHPGTNICKGELLGSNHHNICDEICFLNCYIIFYHYTSRYCLSIDICAKKVNTKSNSNKNSRNKQTHSVQYSKSCVKVVHIIEWFDDTYWYLMQVWFEGNFEKHFPGEVSGTQQ